MIGILDPRFLKWEKGNHMRFPKIILPILSLLLSQTPAAQQNAPRNPQVVDGGSVIFSLTKDTQGGFHIQPVVILINNKYTQPPVGENAGLMKKFTDKYFRVGNQYQVIFGGAARGV